MAGSSTTHFFSADHPIVSTREDLLARSMFAESLASTIGSWKGKESLVLALYGPWGSGKSSIKNMVLESLAGKENGPSVVEFNPWHWSGQNQLAEAFFQEIGLAIGKDDVGEDGKGRAAKWRRYGTYLTLGTSITKSLKVMLPLLGIPGSGVLDLISKGLEKSGEVAKDGAAGLTDESDELETLIELKKEISKQLRSLARPVLVVIDDIDRLTAKEIRLLFQLIKANADFPNIVYLLLFQRNIVEDSLMELTPTTGRDYLDKIVQVGFDIPRLERSRLEKILFSRLDELIDDKVTKENYDKNRWINIFIPGLGPYFKTLRDVNRFISSFSFHVSVFSNAGTSEVNFVDLIALEVLRVFEPEVYHRLYEVKIFLTGQYDDDLGNSDSKKERIKKECESIMNLSPEGNREQVKEIIKQLFPKVERVFGGYGFGADDEKWFRELRVCHQNIFDRYFLLTIPEGDISKADLEKILSLAGDREALVKEFKSLSERGLLGVAFNRLEAYKQELSLDHAVPFITAILDVGEILPENEEGFFSISSDWHAIRIIHWYLMREKDIRKRVEILKKAIGATDGLHLAVMKVSIEDNKTEREKDQEKFLVDEDGLKVLMELCVNKIKNAAKSGELARHSMMASILYRWKKWNNSEEPRNWASDLVKSKEGVLAFLRAFIKKTKVQSSGDYLYQVRHSISLKNLEEFVSVELLKAKIDSFNGLTEEEQKTIRIFQTAVKRREEGNPDDGWWYEEDGE